MGIGSFGPVDIRVDSPNYGCITTTPKVKWRNFNMVDSLKEMMEVPMVFQTDVTMAALGEAKFGAAKGLSNCIYITIGTGIGAGAIINGQFLEGLSHPEMGHILVQKHPDDSFAGVCPIHHDCLEGLAAGPAIEKRWGKKGNLLADNDAVWELEGYYIAQALMNYILTLSPEKIIIGGGVIKQRQLLPIIYKYVKEFNKGYIAFDQLEAGIADYIVTPGIEGFSAIKGGFYAAKNMTTVQS
jgi:fructokinase